MPSRNEIVAAARECLGTKFHHQGRLPGVGLDCIGLIVHVMRKLSVPFTDYTNYSRYPDGVTLRREMEKSLDHISVEEIQEGDVLEFRIFRHPQHIGIRTDYGIIHTYATVGRVVEHVLDETWKKKITGAYRFRGVV